MPKDIDIVVFGATGFTGRLTIDYLAKHAPDSVRLAIGGRDRKRLDEIRAELAERFGKPVEVIVADAADEAALRTMCRRTQVVLTTVGPYVRYGFPLARACVDEGADYCDITGEPEFVDRLQIELGERAKERGVRLISCCGFDSIPHDLGAYFTVREMKPTGPVEMKGVVQAGGGISGGTWHSAVGAMSRLRHKRQRPEREPATDGRKVKAEKQKPKQLGDGLGWVLPFPSIDPEIVLRSAAGLSIYGPKFQYGHYVRAGKLSSAIGLAGGVGAVAALSQVEFTKRWLLKFKSPGDGPTEEQRRRGYFRVTFLAQEGFRKFTARVAGGEPGYAETSKMLAECGLGLVLDRERLPKRSGVLTPVLAFEDVLVSRLQAAGIRFEVVSDDAGAQA